MTVHNKKGEPDQSKPDDFMSPLTEIESLKRNRRISSSEGRKEKGGTYIRDTVANSVLALNIQNRDKKETTNLKISNSFSSN